MKLMVIDGNSLINRAFYAVRMLNAPDGTPTNAVFGFLSILQKLLREESPDALCVAFDLPDKTFRHTKYEGYKATRKPMPEELAVQMPLLKEVLSAMGAEYLEVPGYEADDIIGTISARAERGGFNCLVVTGDKDSFQLIGENTAVRHVKTRMGKTETILYDAKTFFEEYGFPSAQIIDLKALMGDPSDNIPGIPGVGEKTATDLVRRFGSIDNIYRGLDGLDIRDSLKKKLADGRELCYLSYELATICTEVPIDFDIQKMLYQKVLTPKLHEIFQRLGFKVFIKEWSAEAPKEDPQIPEESSDERERITVTPEVLVNTVLPLIQSAEFVALLPLSGLESFEIFLDGSVYFIQRADAFGEYGQFLEALFSEDVKKISHGVKDLCRLLMDGGYPCGGFVFDTELAAYLLQATDTDFSLETLSGKYLSKPLSGAEAVFELYAHLLSEIEKLDMQRLFFDIELPLCRVLAEMEHIGFAVDRSALSEFGDQLAAEIGALEKAICELAGEQFNINSTKQLAEILFDKLLLPTDKKTKTGYSTNIDVLEKLRDKHPIIEAIIKYRELTKLKSTYSDGLLKVIAEDGRIHTVFKMTVTATGRLSSTEPNLQNIPIRRELGSGIRKMFIAGDGMTLVDADYSQIELRLLAHISGDQKMREAFLSGEDIHAVTASQVFDIPLEEVTPELRSRAKAVNFGIVYGISDFSLAQDIGVTRAEARRYIDSYLGKYNGVREYMKDIVVKAKQDGFVATLFNRRRYLPELTSKNYNVRSFGERVALNMPIQGSAADIIKLAMVNASRTFSARGLRARLILQVHDELIAECPPEERAEVMQILSEEMQGAASLSVPLVAEAHSGRSWLEAK